MFPYIFNNGVIVDHRGKKKKVHGVYLYEYLFLLEQVRSAGVGFNISSGPRIGMLEWQTKQEI